MRMGIRDRFRNRLMPEGGISVAEAMELLSGKGILVDVRTLPEYEAGHAPGARSVQSKQLTENPFDAVFGDDPFAEPDAVLVLICDTGLRSGFAAQAVRTKGMAAEFVKDGLRAWRDAGQVLIPGPPRRPR